MNTVVRNPATSTPLPLMPCRLNQDAVIGTVPAWWPSTHVSPQTANTIRMRYSTTAIATWVRAEILMPTIEIASMIRTMTEAIRTLGHVLFAGWPNTARMLGPSAVTGVSE